MLDTGPSASYASFHVNFTAIPRKILAFENTLIITSSSIFSEEKSEGKLPQRNMTIKPHLESGTRPVPRRRHVYSHVLLGTWTFTSMRCKLTNQVIYY